MSNTRILALAAAAVGLAAVVAYDRAGGSAEAPAAVPAIGRSPSPEAAAPRSDPLAELGFGDNPLASLKLEPMREMIDRPPFSSGRRPARPAVAAVEPPAALAPPQQRVDRFVLLGIASGTTGSIAVLRDLVSGRIVKAHSGAQVGAWQAKRITSSTIMLVKDSETIELSVFGKHPAGTAGQ